MNFLKKDSAGTAACSTTTTTTTNTQPTTGVGGGGNEVQWYFSQVKGTMEDEVNDADIISTVEFNEDGELLATGDKGGRIVIFQREQPSKATLAAASSYAQQQSLRTEYNVYSTFQVYIYHISQPSL